MISGRALVWGLVALNAVVFVWASGLFADQKLEPQRLNNQIQADRLRVQPYGESPAIQPPVQEAPASAAPTDQDPTGPRAAQLAPVVAGMIETAAQASPGIADAASGAMPLPESGTPAPPPDLTGPAGRAPGEACLAFESLNYMVYQRLASQMREAGLTVAGERTDEGRYLVYLGPFKSLAEAEAFSVVARRKGIRDLHILRGGHLRNAISLGLLSTRDKAVRHREQLVAVSGLTDMAIGPLDPLGSRYRLEASGDMQLLAAQLRPANEITQLATGACRLPPVETLRAER